MAIHVGKDRSRIFHGDQHPAELYGPSPDDNGIVKYDGFNKATVNGDGRVELGTQPYKAALPSVVVQGVGRQEKLTGKNLLGLDALNASTETWVVPAKKLTIIGNPNTVYVCSSNIPFPPDHHDTEQKTVYFCGTTWGDRVGNGSGVAEGKPVIFQTNNTGEMFIAVALGRLNAKQALNGTYYLQIEKGSTPTPYEPYCGGIPAPNPEYPIEPEFLEGASITDGTETANIPILRALPDGSVRDEIDLRTGTVTRRILEVELTGDERNGWFQYGGSGTIFFTILEIPSIYGSGEVNIISDAYRGQRDGGGDARYPNCSVWNQSNPLYPRTYIRDDSCDTAQSFVEKLKDRKIKGTPVTIWYALATPIIEHYDPQILRQHPGYTQLLQQGGFAPAPIEAEYYERIYFIESQGKENGIYIKTDYPVKTDGDKIIIGGR